MAYKFNTELAKMMAFLTFGIIAWTIAAVVAIVIGAAAKIIWVCVVGAALGLVGVRVTISRARRGDF